MPTPSCKNSARFLSLLACVSVLLAEVFSCTGARAQSNPPPPTCIVTGGSLNGPIYWGQTGQSESFTASVSGDPTPQGEWELNPNVSPNPTYNWGQGPTGSNTYSKPLTTSNIGLSVITAGCTVTYYYLSTDPRTPGATTSVSLSGACSVPYTVLPPVVSISVKNLVKNGKTVTGTVQLSQPSQTPSSFSVTLTQTSSGSGQVSFSPSSITVPSDGSSVQFQMSGSATSSALNDVSVTATGGASSQPTSVTVFDFTNPTCTATPYSPPKYKYSVSGSTASLDVPGHDGIQLSAGVTVTPTGADPTNYQLGVIQNGFGRTDALVYGSPLVTWNQNVTQGTVGYLASSVDYNYHIGVAIDVSNGPAPFYDPTVGVSSTWNDNDGPNLMPPSTVHEKVLDKNQNVIGMATYQIQSAAINATFGDWCSLLDTDDGSISYPGASAGWNCNVYSGSVPVGPQSGGAPGGAPYITTGMTANALMANVYASTGGTAGGVESLAYPNTH